MPTSRASKPGKSAEPPRLSRSRRPPELPVADRQTALRRQFGSEQDFQLANLGVEPVFSEFEVHNPASAVRYRVVIRGTQPGQNSCTCFDYTTNHLGTCKHIEFTLTRLARRRGGKKALAAGHTPAASQIQLDHAGPRRVRFHAGSACPPRLLAAAGRVFDAGDGWALRDAPADGPAGTQTDALPAITKLLRLAQSLGHDLQCDAAAWDYLARLNDARQRREALARAYPKGAGDKALRKLLKVQLYAYQAEGALFAAGAGRALLGDDMGLGKTVQAIATAELLARHFGVRRVLVVCPTSLKHQWKAEFARFTDRGVQVVHGMRPRRAEQFADDAFCKIVHYETLARDADLIAAWAPDLVIADEAQRIKNWNTIAARALKRIASPYAVVLTGTPLENRLEELISIVQFVDQHRLGPTWRLLDQHQTRDEAGRVVGYRALDRIGQTLAPLLLRRRKAEVLSQLPARVDQRIFVPLTPEQRLQHDEQGAIVTRIVSRWRKTGYLSDVDQRRLQCALQAMRMACNSTYLLDHKTDHGHKTDELMTLLDELFQTPGTKAVVFSQWLKTHELIVRRLRHGVQVVNFIGQGAIEEGMLGVLAFKTSLAAGVLDGGDGDIVLQGTRLSQFMQSVEQVAGAMGEAEGAADGDDAGMAVPAAVPKLATDALAVEPSVADLFAADPSAANSTPAPCAAADPWTALLEAGSALLQGLAAARPAADGTPAPPPFVVERDPATGQASLRLPLPDAAVMRRMAQALQPWLR